MTGHDLLVVLAIVLAVAGFVPYLYDTWRGRTRPNRAAWLIFTTIGVAGTVSSWCAGGGWGLVVPATYAVLSTTVLALAIRRGEGGWTMLDRVCLGSSAVGLVLWWVSGSPLVAVAMSSLIDVAGTVPIMCKVWRDPASENRVAWRFFLMANLADLLLVDEWTWAGALYPAVLAVAALVLVALQSVALRRGRSA